VWIVVGMNSTTTDIRCCKARRVQIRPLTWEDRERVADEFSHLSEQTRRRRFGGVARRLSERDLDRLSDIDHHDHEALAAIEPGTRRIVGVARYIALPDVPGAAEVAVEVDDAWQGCGIGRQLITELIARARDAGLTRLLAYVSTENLPVLDWVARAGGVAEAHDGDAALYSISLGRVEADQNAA
jgi:GNAT superfamily N-acetyltransferase